MWNDAHRFQEKRYPYAIRLIPNGMVLQPGDGTRYVFLFAQLDDATLAALGASPGDVLLTYMYGSNSGVSACFSPEAHQSYIREKMRVNFHTSNVIKAALDFYFDGSAIGPFPLRYDEVEN